MLAHLGKLQNFSQSGNTINTMKRSSYSFSQSPWLSRNFEVERNQLLFSFYKTQKRNFNQTNVVYCSVGEKDYLPREYWEKMSFTEREKRRCEGEAIPITAREKKYKFWGQLTKDIKVRVKKIKKKLRESGVPKRPLDIEKKKKEELKSKTQATKEKFESIRLENRKKINLLLREKPMGWEKQLQRVKSNDPMKQRREERIKRKKIAEDKQRKKLQGVILFKKAPKKPREKTQNVKTSLFKYEDPQRWKKSPVPDTSRIDWNIEDFEDDSYEFYSLEDDRPPIDILRLIPQEEKRIHFYRTLVIRTGKECTKFIKMVKNLDLRKLSKEEQDAIFSRKEAVEKQIEKFEEDRQLFLMSDHIYEAMDEITIPQFDPVINPQLKENLYQTWVQAPTRWTLEKLAQKFRLKKLRGSYIHIIMHIII
jgi:hypothetical protein